MFSDVPQGSVLGPLFFLIHVNDLPEGVMSICKIFGDDTSLFSKVTNTINFENTLNADLKSISNWAYQWKTQFNPIIIFSQKSNPVSYPPVIFNNNIVLKCLHQEHLGVVLDFKLDFSINIEHKIKRCDKIIGLLRKLFVCFLNLLSDLFSTMKIFCMRNQTIKTLKKIDLKRLI